MLLIVQSSNSLVGESSNSFVGEFSNSLVGESSNSLVGESSNSLTKIYLKKLRTFKGDGKYYVINKIIRYWPERKIWICFDGKCALSLCIYYSN
jgi:hypothetical protein